MSFFSTPSQLHEIKFGTDGWRALIAKEFTYANLEIFLNGLALYLLENYGTEKPLLIGYDARLLADKFAQFAIDKITSWGIEVRYIDHPVPTPVIAFAAKENNSCGALIFTASHNPPEYMGIKYIPEYAGPSSKAITDKILDKIDIAVRGEFTNNAVTAKSELIEVRESYFEHIRSIIDFGTIQKANQKQQTKLVYDPLFGCGRNYTNKLLEELGFDLITIHDIRDPSFGGSMPDPSEPQLQELRQTILDSKSDLGAANDGDADRFAFMDETGAFYPANKTVSIILKYLLEYRGYRGVIARTVATTHLLDDIARKFDLNTIETAVGFKWLCEVMLDQDTVIAAEESGGMSILGHIPEKDGVLAIVLMAEVLAVTGKKLSVLWQEVQDFVGKNYFYNRLDLHLEGQAKDDFMALFNDDLNNIGDFEVKLIDRTEGAKVYLDDGSWFLARPSGTEAMCRVYFEGNDKGQLDKLVAAVSQLVETRDA
ncbi:MAG: phosphoglucomutase/phosphomannomutase family protein [Cyanobacteria bacterium]|nr:phosphoglucomutase/phosphomannomutase family protein [Cyanobacteriota bacterium]